MLRWWRVNEKATAPPVRPQVVYNIDATPRPPKKMPLWGILLVVSPWVVVVGWVVSVAVRL